MKKKALFLLMLVGSLIASCADSVENGQDSSNPPLQTVDVNQACVNLDKSFMTYTRANTDIITFPDNYGGAYIENGQLVIQIKGFVNQDIQNEYQGRTRSADIRLISCEYSYNELKALKDEISKFFSNESNYDFIGKIGWSVLTVDEEFNRVIIRMDCTPANIAEFKSKVSSSSLIQFDQSNGIPQGYASQMKPCAKINRLGTTSAGSIGYRAKDASGNVGIVTAGHVPHNTNIFMEYENEILGQAKYCTVSEKVDGAFIPYDTKILSFTYVTKFGGASISTTLGTGYKKGTAIKFEGAKTAVLKTGTIANPSTDAHIEYKEGGDTIRKTLNDFIEVNVYSQVGDSGGLCYLTSNNPIGILSAGDGVTAYMCKIANINSRFSLTMY